MLNIDKLKSIKEDNHKIFHELLIQIDAHSDSDPNLLNAIENISRQMNNMTEVINYFLQKE